MEDEMDVEAIKAENDTHLNNEQNASQQGRSQSTTTPCEDDNGSTCPICLEAWTNYGDHRICALKCGHLFGHKCILRWIESQFQKSCPTCKKPVEQSDLHFIYPKKLVPVDNMELKTLKKQLDSALIEKNNALQSESKFQNKYMCLRSKHIDNNHVLLAKIEKLKKTIQEKALGSEPSDFRLTLLSPISKVRLHIGKAVELGNESGCRDCRVFDISVPQDLVLIASRPPVDLFGGFGLRKLSLGNYTPITFIPLHKELIRDMCIHPVEKRVLTVSIDKTFKITDTRSTRTLFSVRLDSVPWSCVWSPRDPGELFVGMQNGSVSIFDIRNLNMPKLSLYMPGDVSPVISLAGVQEASRSDVLLVTKLNSVWAFECHQDGTANRHLLPLEGPFSSLRYDQETKLILASSKPNSHMAFARHTVCHLENSNPDTISCNIVHTFKGGNTAKLLNRTSCFLPNNIVAGHHETRKSILLFNGNTGEEVGSCPTHDNTVLDMKGVDTPNGRFLTYLNEKKLEFFKFEVQLKHSCYF